MKKVGDKIPINQELLEEVAEALDLPIKQVKEITNVQSKFTAEIIRSNLFDSIRWPYFGTFKAKVKQANIINYMKGLTPAQRKFFTSQKYLQYISKKNKKKKKK